MNSFTAFEMEYTGGTVASSDICMIPFSDIFYPQYERIYNECFYAMRKALNIQPYNFYSDLSQMDSSKEIFLLTDNRTIIGSVGIIGTEIDDLIVNSQFQGIGYGIKLLFWAINHIRKYSDEPIILHVADWNKRAVDMYLRNGFVITKSETI